MADKKLTHTHKLKKLRYKSGNIIFFCTLPDCKFKSSVPLLLGKRAICWRCGDEFLMSDYSLRLAKPHCENCHQSKNYDYPIDNADHEYAVEPMKQSLTEQLQQTLNQAKTEEEEEL